MFYVLNGTLQFSLDENTIDAPAGTLVVVPEGAVHTFRNISGDPLGSRFGLARAVWSSILLTCRN
jgi:mannose-6-phosphate isomerase-like protein (cupin superfamily)